MIFELGIKDAFEKISGVQRYRRLMGTIVAKGDDAAYEALERAAAKVHRRAARNPAIKNLSEEAYSNWMWRGRMPQHGRGKLGPIKVAASPGPNLPPRDGPSDAGGAAAESGSTGTPTNLAERQPSTARTGPGTRKGDWMGNFRNLGGAGTRAKG